MILNHQPESFLGRLRLGVQRRFGATSLLADPWQRAVYDDLQALKPRSLTRTPVSHTRFVVIDTETTGLHAYAGDEIISIALVELHGFKIRWKRWLGSARWSFGSAIRHMAMR